MTCTCDNHRPKRFVDLDTTPSARDFIRTESIKPGAYREPSTFTDAAAHSVMPVTDAEVARVKRTGRSLAAFLNRRLRLAG